VLLLVETRYVVASLSDDAVTADDKVTLLSLIVVIFPATGTFGSAVLLTGCAATLAAAA
jgi:hypothetical protein